MPPSKKQQAKAVAPAETSPPSATLLTRCSRADLERMLEESVTAGVPVTHDTVRKCLPETKQGVVIQRPVLKDGPARVGTGRFDDLDDDLLIAIIAQISSTRTRLACAIAVCKAWRSVLLQCPSLFTVLDMRASEYDSSRSDSLTITSSNFGRLLKFLPDVAAVTALTLDTGNKHASLAPDVVKRAIPLFKGLTHLSLSGKKTTSALLAVVAKQPFCSQLQKFELGATSAKTMDALALLTSATRLETLKIHLDWDGDGSFFRSLANRWREKRGGDAVPLLSHIETTGFSTYLQLQSFFSFPDLFPELTVLKTSLSQRDLQRQQLHNFIPLFGPPAGFMTRTTLARLRVLAISNLITYSEHHLSSQQLHNLLRALFHLVPNLTSLKINHGTTSVSKDQAKQGKRVDPHPSPMGALAFLPPSLTTLELGTMLLDRTDFDLTVGLASLQKLTLASCGPHALEIASSLARDKDRCPLLTSKKCFITDPSAAGRWPRLICIDPTEEQEAKRKAALEGEAIEHRVGEGEKACTADSSTSGQSAGSSEGDADGAMED